MNADTIRRYGDELFEALRARQTVAPLTEREPGLTVEDAYLISRHLLERRLALGERLVGRKIGVTSKAVQNMLNVHQPDFGFLTDSMRVTAAQALIGKLLIQPKAEGEIAFVLGRDLPGPNVTPADVLAATEYVSPCIEIVDSRIRDWKIRIEDTVADNASSGLFVVGDTRVDPRQVDLVTCGVVVWKNETIISTAAGAAVMGSPLNAVAWLANTLAAFGTPLKAGEVILSGSPVPLEPVKPGDRMRVAIGGLGAVSVHFE